MDTADRPKPPEPPRLTTTRRDAARAFGMAAAGLAATAKAETTKAQGFEPLKPGEKFLQPEVIETGSGFQPNRLSPRVIRSQRQFDNYFNTVKTRPGDPTFPYRTGGLKVSAPVLSFESFSVLAVLDQKRPAGSNVEIISVRESDGEVVVTVLQGSPEHPDSSQESVSPYTFVRIPKIPTGTNVSFDILPQVDRKASDKA